MRSLLLLGSVSLLAFASACVPAEPGELEQEDTEETEGALGEAKIVFGADYSETVQGKLRAGDPIQIAYDPARLPSCRGEQNGTPQWAITAFYRVGGGDVHAVSVAGLMAPAGPATIVPDSAGKLEVWFQVTNVWGCNEYDSDFGNNYKFSVAAPVGQPGWAGNTVSVINRWTCEGGPCDFNRNALENGFVFDTWARQRAAIAGLYFDVWEEGVTDYDNADLWKQVDAQVHFRFTGQEAFTTRYVDFFRRNGNDARYQVLVRTIDPFFAMPSVVSEEQCPAAELTVSPNGQYVQTEVELYFTADGVEIRPAPGETFKGRFEDYVGPYAACL
ncbi:MAG: hypothetical protein JNL21_25070 [Myxococcales bacterium]|nr:hypothetical protein [Myxococcales bacterium]